MTTIDLPVGDWIQLTIRLAIAMLLGGAIGWNRQASRKAAGLRTHMLVSLGSALFVIIPLATSASTDAVSRAIQGVATGIGFLGAGEILHQNRTSGKQAVRGLTSAAAIWVTAALGMLAGCGLWQISVVGTGMTLFILAGAKQVEERLKAKETPDSAE